VRSHDTDAVTLVNVFEVAPENLDSFLLAWRERAEFMSTQPGFRALQLLRAVSVSAPFQLVNITEWDSIDALQAATTRDEFQETARRAVERFGVIAHPGVYQLAVDINRRV
jgi:heme-degrading monooxygenase HmoA